MHAAVAEDLRRRHHLRVADLSIDTVHQAHLMPTFLQAGTDVHGSHGLFYWLRARCRGRIVAAARAATVLTWRPDVQRMVALRPVGQLDAVIDILDAAARTADAETGGAPFVARYCADELAARLRDRGWIDMTTPWQPGIPADDETYPEVIVTAPVADIPHGQRYRPVREAITRHSRRYTYTASPTPRRIGEAELITHGAARATDYDGHEMDFNTAVLAAMDSAHHDWLTYHYLIHGERLAGFAITANITGMSHGYYLSTHDAPRLTAYFLWSIYLQQRRSGAFALNLGGSETASLHQFKMHTFPEHVLQHTAVLQHPGQ